MDTTTNSKNREPEGQNDMDGGENPSIAMPPPDYEPEVDDDPFQGFFHGSDNHANVCEALLGTSDAHKIEESISLSNKDLTVHVDRRLVEQGIDERFLRAAKESALAIVGVYSDIKEHCRAFCQGQVGIVEDHDGNDWMVTNKHLVCQSANGDLKMTMYIGANYSGYMIGADFFKYILIPHGIATSRPLDVPGMKHLPWGVDVACEKLLNAERKVHESIRSFKLCPTDYDYSVGTEIAMAIYKAPHTENVTIEEATDTNANDFFGQESSVTILKGEITGVGDNHFLHNINAYNGCAGAIIFLLDNPQSADENHLPDNHQLMAIGVHSGYCPNKRMNYGFPIHLEGSYQPENFEAFSNFLENNIKTDQTSYSIKDVLEWLDGRGVSSLWRLHLELTSEDHEFQLAFIEYAGISCALKAAALTDPVKNRFGHT